MLLNYQSKMRPLIEDKYLIGVSGGADSMALLDMVYHLNKEIVVAHVNYKKRLSADRDQHIVEDYCRQRNIPFFVHIAKKHDGGNFQNIARIERYDFFNKIMHQEKIKTLLVAHQKDDALETYLFKKKRNSLGESLSILESSNVFGIHVFRPLLDYYRSELRDYCLKNNIPFGDDETNFTLDYERNRIRILVLGNLTLEQKDALVNKMNHDESEWQLKNEKIKQIYNKIVVNKHFNYEAYLDLDKTLKALFLYRFININTFLTLNKHYLNEIIKQLDSKSNLKIDLGKFNLIKAYSDVYLMENKEVIDYSYTILNLEEMDTPYFKIKLSGEKKDGIYVSKEDFPLTIRNYRVNDKVRMKDYDKDVNRLFIDRKIDRQQRRLIPLVVNAKQEIILIPGIYRLYERKLLQSNIFVVK